MKRLFLIIALIIFVAGVANAANIARVVDPKNQPEVWTTIVYNNDDAVMNPGAVVIWDIDASTGDNDNYVTITTTADTQLVAGIVYPTAIPVGGIGSIAIYGCVDVDYNAAETVADVVCTSGTEQEGADCTTDYYGFGYVVEAADPGKTCINIHN
uniref:Uncharacterized protein n=1 Tax=viral metagenome TaxID=1070528 RepID=A0A6M3LI06_9ZZZZ